MSTRWTARVEVPWSLEQWRALARQALRSATPPEAIDWLEGADASSLLEAPDIEHASVHLEVGSVPKEFLELAATVICHRDRDRFAHLYRVLWRLTRGSRLLLRDATDPDVAELRQLHQQVRRDSHKMKAFVRFRETAPAADDFVAWYEPDHYVVDRVAPFFARRFTGMHWAIVTPYRSCRWDGVTLSFGEGSEAADMPREDGHVALWQTYYANIFNPARPKPKMMRQEMPTRYWKNLPEARLIPALERDAGQRVREMAERPAEPARRRIPRQPAPPIAVSPTIAPSSLDQIATQVKSCRDCELWQPATQAVPGQGEQTAAIMLVGEQPGDAEDLSGRPFVGPAGQVLRRALAEAGVPADSLYMTNAVKHFRFSRRGKRRIHERPSSSHVAACHGWLMHEISLIKPRVVVCLGATAARAVLGRDMQIGSSLAQVFAGPLHPSCLVTFHPSAVLRAGDGADGMYAGLLATLQHAGELADMARADGDNSEIP